MKIFLFILIVVLFGAAVFLFIQNKNTHPLPSTANDNEINWMFDGEKWQTNNNPPACPDPLIFPAPVDVHLASEILYPGQIRGNDYKPHGGFRFDNQKTNKIEVKAIMDGYVLKAARYDDDYDTQISIFFVNDCGIMAMHDHLLTLSPRLEEILKDVKVASDSRTTFIEPRVYFEKGELLATEVGYPNFPGGASGKNIFVDFGLYDLRKTNGVYYDSEFRAEHPNINEYGTHALCWFDNLTDQDRSFIKNLQAGGNEGKVSDYCD